MRVITVLLPIALATPALLVACEATAQLELHLEADFECTSLCWDDFDDEGDWIDGACVPYDVVLVGQVKTVSGSIENVVADVTTYDEDGDFLIREKIPIQLHPEEASTFRMPIGNENINQENAADCDEYSYDITLYSLEGDVVSSTGN